MTGSALFNGEIQMGKGRGKLRIAILKGLAPTIRDVFKDDTPDHRVLSVAYDWQEKLKNKSQVILVTKDVNLRMKAKALGILAEDYTTDRVKSIEELYRLGFNIKPAVKDVWAGIVKMKSYPINIHYNSQNLKPALFIESDFHVFCQRITLKIFSQIRHK